MTVIEERTATVESVLEVLDLSMLIEGEPQCTLFHQQGFSRPMPACTHKAVARVRDSCANQMGLGCAPGIEWVKSRIATDDIRCICKRRPSECWSVMDL